MDYDRIVAEIEQGGGTGDRPAFGGPRPNVHPDDHLAMARFLLESGWNQEMNLEFETLFPGMNKGLTKEALDKLPKVTYDEITDKEGQCMICLAQWSSEDTQITLLQCKHHFHSRCVSEWLTRVATCPACRKELPTDNELYEEHKRQQKRKQERQADIDELHDSMFS